MSILNYESYIEMKTEMVSTTKEPRVKWERLVAWQVHTVR